MDDSLLHRLLSDQDLYVFVHYYQLLSKYCLNHDGRHHSESPRINGLNEIVASHCYEANVNKIAAVGQAV